MRYALLTAAYNEESFIQRTIESVITQSQLPERWVIVSDGSTDRTDAIINSYCASHRFIEFVRTERIPGIGSKVKALRNGFERLAKAEYELLGNLDADICLDSDYYQRLQEQFLMDPRLGIASGAIFEETNGTFGPRFANSIDSVPHAAQLVRRECYSDIGGYHGLKYGGEDWYAEVIARMQGWRTRSFSDLRVLHLRPTGGSSSWIEHRFRQGREDFSMGSDPLFQLFKCARRITDRPLFFGSVARLTGFFWSCFSGERRFVPDEVAQFLRSEQRARIRQLFRGTTTSGVSRLH